MGHNNIAITPAERIKTAALRRIAGHGPAGLDLPAIAADAGVPAEDLHEHFGDRSGLLTAMILDAYNAMGQAAEESDRKACGQDAAPLQRWVAICRAARAWAQAHPEEYKLIWGPPLPEYSAPPETMIAGARTALTLIAVVRAADSLNQLQSDPGVQFSAGMQRNVQMLGSGMIAGVPDDVIARLLVVWTQLLGAISFAVYGHVNGFAADPAAFFDYAAENMGRYVGLRG
ncbi:TetR/AcrR family transcriptional regulator [Actinoplanes sp. N902-109]|uniref:TetR/AcrR family transcriptional regulator n=1 Tax=Actinoplanes sp. (strain N902-109) TaxID=649831 RepID=UPI00032967A8|nr:TetR-like C-terminal domain-containing protein [Actinoplanes sp. N902-109]AGL15844.1 hypothetical protein L083_2334 [Actinoplanes sp. N902-109]